jgi:hypothetical protein
MALGLFTLGTILGFTRFQTYALRKQSGQLELQATARAIVELFASEVRRAGSDPKCTRSFEAVSEAGNDQLRIRADLNGNGGTGGAGEDVFYRCVESSTTCVRIANGVTSNLLPTGMTVSRFRIEYRDAMGALLVPEGNPARLTTSQRAAVRQMSVVIELRGQRRDPSDRQVPRVAYGTSIDLRNRYFFAGSNVACS